jgi:hypothetical protein
MQKRIDLIEAFLETHPDHGPPLLRSSVARIMAAKNMGTYPSSAANPFRPTHQEINDPVHCTLYPVGPNGKRGYPTKPGEKTEGGYLVQPSKPNVKDSATEIIEEFESLKRKREPSPVFEKEDLTLSLTDSEENQVVPSSPPENDNEPPTRVRRISKKPKRLIEE